MRHFKRRFVLSTLAISVLLLLAASCAASEEVGDDAGEAGDAGETEQEGAGFEPESPQIVVSSGPGGGSDVIARQIADVMSSEGITATIWPVENVEGGAGAAAMGLLMENEGNNEMVGVAPLGWLTTPMSLGEDAITIEDLTPIAQWIVEPMVMAVPDDSEFESLSAFVDAALAGENLVQVGGQVNSIGDLARRQFEEEAGATWDYLPVESGGERIPALIRGDADMMFGSPADFAGQTVDDGGDIRIIATIGPERTAMFPDAPTHSEEGYDFEIGLAFRGVVGPPGMSDEAVAYYENVFEQVLETDAWQEIADEYGYTTQFRGSEEWEQYLLERQAQLEEVMG